MFTVYRSGNFTYYTKKIGNGFYLHIKDRNDPKWVCSTFKHPKGNELFHLSDYYHFALDQSPWDLSIHSRSIMRSRVLKFLLKKAKESGYIGDETSYTPSPASLSELMMNSI